LQKTHNAAWNPGGGGEDVLSRDKLKKGGGVPSREGDRERRDPDENDAVVFGRKKPVRRRGRSGGGDKKIRDAAGGPCHQKKHRVWKRTWGKFMRDKGGVSHAKTDEQGRETSTIKKQRNGGKKTESNRTDGTEIPPGKHQKQEKMEQRLVNQ